LIDGEIVFGPRKMNGRDSPEKTLIGSLEGRFASKGLCLVHLNQATPLWITLLNQIAFHSYYSITRVLSLASERALWYTGKRAKNTRR
jgi:hypothetical protein